MKNYFFIPGSKLEKVDTIKKLNVSIVIDLEDAVKFSDREKILNDLLSCPSCFGEFFIRIPLYSRESFINTSFLEKLIAAGYKKFIFPKLEKAKDFKDIISTINNDGLELILLVETTRFFLELKEILLDHRKLFKAISLGSHDFMNEVGGNYTLKNLEYARLQLLYLARMINIEAIDIASMELKDENKLREEILDGFEKGYDAKFYIHPWQLATKENMELYTTEDLLWAKKVLKALAEVDHETEFNPKVIDDQIIERPHLNRAKKIIQYYGGK